MNETIIETSNLNLVLQTREDIRVQIERMSPSERAEVSADWLALVESAGSPDPWLHGFAVIRRVDDAVVGSCGFKGPPTADGVVEIAYGIRADYQGNGYATEAARALVRFALNESEVRVVRAHTMAADNASAGVLSRCGFRRVGQVVDAEDGPVWRWEKADEAA